MHIVIIMLLFRILTYSVKSNLRERERAKKRERETERERQFRSGPECEGSKVVTQHIVTQRIPSLDPWRQAPHSKGVTHLLGHHLMQCCLLDWFFSASQQHDNHVYQVVYRWCWLAYLCNVKIYSIILCQCRLKEEEKEKKASCHHAFLPPVQTVHAEGVYFHINLTECNRIANAFVSYRKSH